ncbi:MAG: hypothetical protein AB1635_16690 [Acidobacteriota bacterium]
MAPGWRILVLSCVAGIVMAAGVAEARQAPGVPGDPMVTVDGFNVNVQWTAPTTGGPPSGYQLLVTRNGATLPGSPFNLPPAPDERRGRTTRGR